MVDMRVREEQSPNRLTEPGDRGRERLPLRSHHQRVDDGEPIVVCDHAGVAHARLTAGLQPDEDTVGDLVEIGHVQSYPATHSRSRRHERNAPVSMRRDRTDATEENYINAND